MKTKRFLAVAMAFGLLAATANADFTDKTGFLLTEDIMESIYGGTFVASGEDFNNGGGGVTATRVDDFFNADPFDAGSNLNILTGMPGSSSSDQVWDDGLTTATAHARFAGFSQDFGYYSGASGAQNGGSFVQMGPTIAGGFQDTFLDTVDFSGQEWRWGRTGDDGSFWGSVADENSDDLDHMVAYQITGSGASGTTWLLFWDDQDGGGDRDFNDLVVEINAIPAPGAILLGAMGLGLVGWAKRRFS